MFSGNPILSRTMAFLLFFLVVAGAWMLLITPITDQRAMYKADIERSQRLIAAFQSRREDVGVLKRQLEAMRRNPTGRAAYFTARNTTLAAAKLQSRIKALTRAAGAALTSSQVIAREDEKSDLKRVTVRAHMVGSIEAVRSVFHALESGQPYVLIDNVTISANPARRSSNRRRGRPQNNVGLLTVRYEAYGFRWHKKES
jgi:hypothetical protein